MKRTIRSLALVLTAVAGLVAFTATESRADHYWSPDHNRYVTYEFSYQHSYGYPVYMNEFGHSFYFGHNGHRVFAPGHHGVFVSPHHGYGHGFHGGLLELLFGY